MVIEVEESKDKVMILVKDKERPEQYELSLSVNDAYDLLGGNLDYEKLVKMIAFENNEIVLVA